MLAPGGSYLLSVWDSHHVAGFARAAVHGNPLIDQVRARGGVDPEHIVEALTQEFRREFGDGPGRMPIQAIVFSAARR